MEEPRDPADREPAADPTAGRPAVGRGGSAGDDGPTYDGLKRQYVDQVMDRYDALQRAARLLVNGYYENFVLSVYKGLQDRRDDLFLRRLATGKSTALDWDLILAQGQQAAPPLVLQAILSAWRRHGRVGPSAEHVQEELRLRAAPGQEPVDFNAFLSDKLTVRGGFPESDAAHWLSCYHKARELHQTVQTGAYVDYVVSGTKPPEFDEPPVSLALTVERSRSALAHATRASTVAGLRLERFERQEPLADAIEQSTRMRRAEIARDNAQRRVSRASRDYARAYTEYGAALVQAQPPPRPPRNSPPRRGR